MSTVAEPRKSLTKNEASDRRIIVEPLICIVFFAQFLSNQFLTNHIIYRACRHDLVEDDAICRLLENQKTDGLSKELSEKVQPFVAAFLTEKNFIETLIPAVISLFLGSWSDKNGRKKIILISYCGFMIQFAMLYILSSVSAPISTKWYWLPSAIVGISGGNCIFISMLISYLSDTVSKEKNAERMGFFQGMLIMGIFFGSIVSGVLDALSLSINPFLISFGLLFLSLPYLIFGVPESVKLNTKQRTSITKIFDLNLIKSMVESATKRRKNNQRRIIWMIILFFSLNQFMQEGSNVVNFLFFREQFQWTVKDLSFFIVAATLCIVIGTIFGLQLQKRLELDESMACAYVLSTLAISNLLTTFSTQTWHLYVGLIVGVFRGVPDALARSIMRKCLDEIELGKINTMIGALQAVSALLGAPFYSWFYVKSFKTKPTAWLYINTIILIFQMLLFFVIYKQTTTRGSSSKKENEEKKKSN